MSGGVAYAAMSTCNKCGRQFPTAPAGVIHKCVCPGGMMVPDATPVQVTLVSPTPPIEGRDADVERKVEKMAMAMYCADNGMDSDANSAHIYYWFRDPDEKDRGAVDEYRVMARAALQALGERG